jgi:hypothetical protein
MTEMVGVDLCGCEERSRWKAEAFQGFATLEPAQIRPIRRTVELASIRRVKALDRAARSSGLSLHLSPLPTPFQPD